MHEAEAERLASNAKEAVQRLKRRQPGLAHG
jgi:hypothetical protein